MPTITFISAGGDTRVVEAVVGHSVMETAVRNNVLGIEAQCGGAMVCGTCHAYLDAAFADRTPVMEDGERLLLDCGDHQGPTSRLTCQIRVTEALDGAIFHTPPSQP